MFVFYYSSSPEPDTEIGQTKVFKSLSTSGASADPKSLNRKSIWHDLEPDDSDEDEPMTNGPKGPSAPETETKKEPPKIVERPRSPFAELIKPIGKSNF